MNSIDPKLKRGIVLFESRKFPRENIEIPLLYSVRGDNEEYTYHMEEAIDGGILIYIKDNFDIGMNLDIEIFPPEYFGLKSIKAITQIVWTQLRGSKDGEEYEYGLKFIGMDGNSILMLKKLLKYLEQE
ncbi:MAG: PilZ domain-containing protein [Syntrophobacterales bacterium]|nr:MAG: PilZ domain-containing protein [Syntrophobacterales bacterium]